MKKIIFSIVLLIIIFTSSVEAADLNDIFGGIMKGQLVKKEYTFHPGDKVAQREGISIYYSGYELDGANKTLLFTLLGPQGEIVLKYPNPDIIQIKDIRLKVKHFDNVRLIVEETSALVGE